MTQQLDFAGVNDKLPPQNIEAEEAILGGILLDPEAIERVGDILLAEAFYIQAHRDIYAAALRLHDEHKPTDLLTVASWLDDHELLGIVGGRNKLASLVDRTVSAVNIDALAEMVMDKYLSRKLIKAGNEIVKLGYDLSQPLVERLDAAEQKVFSIRHQTKVDDEKELLGDVVCIVYEEIERLSAGEEQSCVPTGFFDLDAILGGGLHHGELIIVAGRTSMGKSSFAHQISFNTSDVHESLTLIFSLEMSKEDITRRFLSSESGIEMRYLQSGKISDSGWEPLARAVKRFDEIPLVIRDESCPTPKEIRSKVRQTIAKYGAKYGSLKLVVVDYLQLMAGGTDALLVQKIGEITRELKLLARDFDLPIILLCQLNRGVENRPNKRPMLSDLRDSGKIEEDADVVLGLYRDEYYFPDTPDRGLAEVIVLKNRNGATGTVKLLFEPQFTRFKNLKIKP